MRITLMAAGIFLFFSILNTNLYSRENMTQSRNYKMNNHVKITDQICSKIYKLNQIPAGNLPSGIDYITDQCWQINSSANNFKNGIQLNLSYAGACGFSDETQLVLLKRSLHDLNWRILADNVTINCGENLSDGFGSIRVVDIPLDSATQIAIGKRSVGWLPNIPKNITAHVITGPVIIQWETICEIDNQAYIIERRIADKPWAKVGSIETFGLSAFPKSYYFEDSPEIDAETRIAYRIKQLDKSGKMTLSLPLQLVYSSGPESSQITSAFIKTAKSSLGISCRTHFRGNLSLEIHHHSGRVLKTLINKVLSKGCYTLYWDFSRVTIEPDDFADSYCKLILESRTSKRSFIHIQDIVVTK